jgi:hypothetical protein
MAPEPGSGGSENGSPDPTAVDSLRARPARVRRLRLGELLALVGAICVIVSLFLNWYENATETLGAWDTFGPAVALLMAAAAASLALVASALAERSPALPVSIVIWSTLLGIAAVIAALVRVFERPDEATRLCAGVWLALGGSVAMLAGALLAMRDERTSLYPPARPTPRTPPKP